MIIGEDQDDVLGLHPEDALGHDGGGHGDDGGVECGASEDEAGEEQRTHDWGRTKRGELENDGCENRGEGFSGRA